jgi:hypothetical protein
MRPAIRTARQDSGADAGGFGSPAADSAGMAHLLALSDETDLLASHSQEAKLSLSIGKLTFSSVAQGASEKTTIPLDFIHLHDISYIT